MTASSGSFRGWPCFAIRDASSHRSPSPLSVWCHPGRAWLDLLRELTDAIHELTAFAAKLEQVARDEAQMPLGQRSQTP